MRRTTWIFVMLLSLALLGAPQVWAGGKGLGQGNGNQAGAAQGQWVNNQPPGWNGHGQKQGWNKPGNTTGLPPGLNKNFNSTGKYPKGLQKPR